MLSWIHAIDRRGGELCWAETPAGRYVIADRPQEGLWRSWFEPVGQPPVSLGDHTTHRAAIARCDDQAAAEGTAREN